MKTDTKICLVATGKEFGEDVVAMVTHSVTHSLIRAGRAEKALGFTDDSLFQDKSLQRDKERELSVFEVLHLPWD